MSRLTSTVVSAYALECCQHELEAAGGWEINQRVETTLARLSLDGEARIEQLFGGLKRRGLLLSS